MSPSTGPRVIVCADVGSTYTKAAAVDADTGALLGAASRPTTAGTDVMDGLDAAAGAAVPEGADVIDTLVCSSAGGGLRLAVIGNEPLVTARAAYRAGLSAGARIVDVRAGALTPADYADLAAARPDVLLLAGGTDGGDDTALRAHAADLAASGLTTPVVLAGNRDAAPGIAALLHDAGIPVTTVANVLPRIGELNPVPARTALREVFLRHVIAGKHLSAAADFTRIVKAATPDAVLTGVEVLADLLGPGTDLLVIDVGGATTDVYSVLTPDPERDGPRADVAGTAWRSRTVEGDLGVRHTALGITDAADEEGLPVPGDLREAARRRTDDLRHPGDPRDDAALSALAARIAVRRHARGERVGGPTEPLRGGKDLAAVGLVVGSGGVLRRDPASPEWLREAVGADTSGGVRPPRGARFTVDADYRLAPAGLLAANGRRDLAEQLLRAWPDRRATARGAEGVLPSERSKTIARQRKATMERRGVIKLGAGLTAGAAVLGSASAAHAETTAGETAQSAATRIKRIFDAEIDKAGGAWQGKVTLLNGTAAPTVAVDHDATSVQTAASMNKLGIALGVLDKIDRGELALDDRITLTSDIILTGSGFYFHQTAYGDEITVANVLVAMLLTSDNTSVRLCGLVCAPAEINEVLAAKGFTDTRVEPNPANPSRMWLGDTTAAETNDLLHRLALGELLSARSTQFFLGVLSGLSGYHDGFRRNMSSAERSRIAMKYGADDANRNESGVVFNADGAPALVYSFLSQYEDHWDNYGATHPAVQAHARMGRKFLDIVEECGLGAADAATLTSEPAGTDGLA